MLFKEKTNIKLLDLLVQLDFFFLNIRIKILKVVELLKKKCA